MNKQLLLEWRRAVKTSYPLPPLPGRCGWRATAARHGPRELTTAAAYAAEN